MRDNSASEGFTLVELMVVVLIIGILVAIAIPVFHSAKSNAQKKACWASQRTIEGAAQTYAAQNGGLYPDAVTDLMPSYVKETPECPLGAGAFTAINPANGQVVVGAPCTHGHF